MPRHSLCTKLSKILLRLINQETLSQFNRQILGKSEGYCATSLAIVLYTRDLEQLALIFASAASESFVQVRFIFFLLQSIWLDEEARNEAVLLALNDVL